uniref:Uncharacterized protein n=1 Tax=Timema bartmani TaxID=61472 RepID=A0A7R9I688_9NEOP|nr:unnamed protein product [Timema bartmani]
MSRDPLRWSHGLRRYSRKRLHCRLRRDRGLIPLSIEVTLLEQRAELLRIEVTMLRQRAEFLPRIEVTLLEQRAELPRNEVTMVRQRAEFLPRIEVTLLEQRAEFLHRIKVTSLEQRAEFWPPKSSPQKQMDQSEVDFRIWLESQRTGGTARWKKEEALDSFTKYQKIIYWAVSLPRVRENDACIGYLQVLVVRGLELFSYRPRDCPGP